MRFITDLQARSEIGFVTLDLSSTARCALTLCARQPCGPGPLVLRHPTRVTIIETQQRAGGNARMPGDVWTTGGLSAARALPVSRVEPRFSMSPALGIAEPQSN